MNIGGRGVNAVIQAKFFVHNNVHLYIELPLVGFFVLMNSWSIPAVFILGEARNRNATDAPDTALAQRQTGEAMYALDFLQGFCNVSVHSRTSCHPGEFLPTVTSLFPTRGYHHEKTPHSRTVASSG